MSAIQAAVNVANVAVDAVASSVAPATCQTTLGHLASLDLVLTQQSAVMLFGAVIWLFFGKFIFGDVYWYVVAWVSIAVLLLLDMPSEQGIVRGMLPDQLFENQYTQKHVPAELKLGATVKDLMDSVSKWPILKLVGTQLQKLQTAEL